MEQIANWLKKLGMSEYAERFTEDRIDLTVLQDLTDQDAKDLGVVLGDRHKMLRDSRSRRRLGCRIGTVDTHGDGGNLARRCRALPTRHHVL